MPVTINGTAGVTFNNSSVASVGGVGDGQTWQFPTRSPNTTYTNTTGKPIMVSLCLGVNNTGGAGVQFLVNGSAITSTVGGAGAIGMYQRVALSAIVPNGDNYSANGAAPEIWAELR